MENAGIHEYGITCIPEKILWFDVQNVSKVPHDAQTAIVCLFPYYIKCEHLNISRYAAVDDYHIICMDMMTNAISKLQKIFPGEYAAFVDNSPFDEVSLAIQAGLGIRGKNGLLITPKYGSWVFIGEIVTDVKFDDSNILKSTDDDNILKSTDETSCSSFENEYKQNKYEINEHKYEKDLCDKCNLCVKNCPTGALTYENFDRKKCISYLTQKKGELTEKEQAMIKSGASAWGCDICQEICPNNFIVQETNISQFKNNFTPIINESNLEHLMKTKPFKWRGEKVVKRNLHIINKK